jgi:glutaminyl-peptide cyclotransferase
MNWCFLVHLDKSQTCFMKNNLCLILLALVYLPSCNTSDRPKTREIEQAGKTESISIPDFNADSAYLYVKQQVDFGPRVPNTPAHEKCADFFVQKLRQYCKDVIVQKGQVKAFDGTVLNFKNIIASFAPEVNNRIFLCSHWDSRPFADNDADVKNHNKPIDGANDGASGVGVLLEVARQLSISRPEIGIDLIFFDVEDYGPPLDQKSTEDAGDWWGLGSQYWSRQQHVENYFARYGILLDMVGAPGATFLKEGISMDYAPEIVDQVWRIANRIGYSGYFYFEKGTYITDDHYYINIIHLDRTSKTGFYHTWHTTNDNLSNIDKNTLKAVGQTLLTVIYEEK